MNNPAILRDRVMYDLLKQVDCPVARMALKTANRGDMVGGKLLFNATRDIDSSRQVWRVAYALVSKLNISAQYLDFVGYFANMEATQCKENLVHNIPLIDFGGNDMPQDDNGKPSGGTTVTNPVTPPRKPSGGNAVKASAIPF